MNLKYRFDDKADEYESDIIIETSDFLFLIEVKSGSFSNSARRGGQHELKNDLKEFIGKAINQTSRTESYLLNSDNPLFYINSKSHIYFDKKKKIIKIAVSFASIIGVTNQLYDMSELGIFEKSDNIPLAVSVCDLMVITDVFSSNLEGFVDYLMERTSLYFNKNILIEDEISFLGLYLSRDFKGLSKSNRVF
jgi:hypothetical protein